MAFECRGPDRERGRIYFDSEDLVVGKVSERPLYCEASIKHRDGRLVDRVIIDKARGGSGHRASPSGPASPGFV